jgi:hypothetical protein
MGAAHALDSALVIDDFDGPEEPDLHRPRVMAGNDGSARRGAGRDTGAGRFGRYCPASTSPSHDHLGTRRPSGTSSADW